MENDQLVLPSVTKQEWVLGRDSGRQTTTDNIGTMASRRRTAAAPDAGVLDARLLGSDASLLVLGQMEGSLGADAGGRLPHRVVQQDRRMVRRGLWRADQLDRFLP